MLTSSSATTTGLNRVPAGTMAMGAGTRTGVDETIEAGTTTVPITGTGVADLALNSGSYSNATVHFSKHSTFRFVPTTRNRHFGTNNGMKRDYY